MHQNQAVSHPPAIRLRHPVNGCPDRQFRPQRERPVDILPQPVRPVRRRQRHALQRKRQFTGTGDGALGWHLDNQAVQDLMPGDHRLQTALVSRQAHPVAETEQHWHVVEIAAAVQILDKPQLQL